MAYKFRMGAAIMSGSLQQEGQLSVEDEDDNRKFLVTKTGGMSASNQAHIAGSVTLSSTLAATGSITAGSSFIIGSADLNEVDMEKLDGITNGTLLAL